MHDEVVAERGGYIMSKSVLIIDTPESCSKCQFMYEFNGIKKCHILNVVNFGKAIIPRDILTTGRKEECPFVELPEQIPLERADYAHEAAYIRGWNECLEKIT